MRGVDGVACVGYLALSFAWSEWYRARGDAWLRSRLGRRFGIPIVWKPAKGRYGSSRIWGFASPVPEDQEARIGFLALSAALGATFLPPLALLVVHARFDLPSPRALAALLLVSLPMSLLGLRNLTAGER